MPNGSRGGQSGTTLGRFATRMYWLAVVVRGQRQVGERFPLLPRLVRIRDAPFYLGMDRNRFNAEVRPHLTEIPVGVQGIAFDRLELDAWVEQYKHRNGRPAQRKGMLKWDERECPVSSTGVVSGTSTNASDVVAFAKALANATSRKRRST
jgi:hypothetical protein